MIGCTSGFIYDNLNTYANHSAILCVLWNDIGNVDNASINKTIRNQNTLLKQSKTKDELVLISRNYDLRYILTLFSSKLIQEYVRKNLLRSKRSYSEDTIRQIPIKKIELKDQKPFIEKADLMLKLNEECYIKKNKFLNRAKQNLKLEKISKKLDCFYELSFEDFCKELKKQKITLSLKEQDEWEDYFSDYKKELLEIKELIDKTDGEIDEMVYGLYGLTDEEIKIVEGVVKW